MFDYVALLTRLVKVFCCWFFNTVVREGCEQGVNWSEALLQGFLEGARAWKSLQCCDGFRDFEAASKVMQGLSRTRWELCSDRCETGVKIRVKKWRSLISWSSSMLTRRLVKIFTAELYLAVLLRLCLPYLWCFYSSQNFVSDCGSYHSILVPWEHLIDNAAFCRVLLSKISNW
jgi:hypothetical protein